MGKRQKILIVDDRPENLFTLEKILNAIDADIIKAGSGNDALIASLNHEFALAIVDVQMPSMSGYELAELLRKGETTRHLPIIFLSAAHSDDYHIFKGYEAGAVDFITKPFDPRILLGKVNIFLELDKQRGLQAEHHAGMEALVRVSTDILARDSLDGLLQHAVDAARELTAARIGRSSHGHEDAVFRVTAVSVAKEVEDCPSCELFKTRGDAFYFGAFGNNSSIRLTDQELRSYPTWRGSEVGSFPHTRGLLGVVLKGRNGEADGFILVSDKAEGDFTDEDEVLLIQLGALVSLGLQHIEARCEAEIKALEAEEGKRILEALMKHAPEGITIADAPDGRIRMMSDYGRHLLGSPEDFLKADDLGKPAMIFGSDGVTPARGEDLPLVRSIRTGEVVTGEEWVLKGSDDKKTTILCNAGPIRDQEGGITGGVLAWRDISERKQMEEELRHARDELEIRVQERTDELERYMAKLEESNQALQGFASIASHDMQEPLRKVISFGNMLRQSYGDSLGEGGRDYLDRMLKATHRMQSLLESVLEYSRVAVKPEPFREVDLTSIVREVLSDLELRIDGTGGEVHVGELPVIEGDPSQMRQLFQNLIANGLKFHKKVEKPVVRVHCSARGSNSCMVVVEDNGIGFDEKYLERIFSPFQRLHGRSSDYEGTGMGLAICKKIVERHGGTITARSAPGEGATFIVTLSLIRPQQN